MSQRSIKETHTLSPGEPSGAPGCNGLLSRNYSPVLLHHPMGTMEVLVDYSSVAGEYINKSAGLVKTARKIAGGEIFAHLAD